jgi:TRAP-type C4-dicarboxylate transport system permease small subunit
MQTLLSLEKKLAALEDGLVMVLVAIIALILGAGVLFRYILNDPLTWSEEFVVTLFVWSVMLGVPSALRARMHIRIDALILRLNTAARRVAGVLAFSAGGVILVAAIYAGWQHTQGVWSSQTPMLGYSMGWIFISMPIGFALTLFHGAVIFFDEGPDAVFRNATESVIDAAET